MHPTTVVLITGHPGSGKTTLARYLANALALPTLCKDDIKEILYDTLGWSTAEWSMQLSIAAWALLYRQVEVLLEAHTDHIVEANFDPKYADTRWQALKERFELRLIQVRCEGDAAVILERFRARILDGTRHPGHRDGSDSPEFYEVLRRGPISWIDVEGERISLDTTENTIERYAAVAERIIGLSRRQKGIE
jgi:predicted kinase